MDGGEHWFHTEAQIQFLDNWIMDKSDALDQAELYKSLGTLTKDKDKWKESIPYVSSLLTHESTKIQVKAFWLLGEMGLVYPGEVEETVLAIADFCESTDPLLRERTVNALGRIGRGNRQTQTRLCETF